MELLFCTFKGVSLSECPCCCIKKRKPIGPLYLWYDSTDIFVPMVFASRANVSMYLCICVSMYHLFWREGGEKRDNIVAVSTSDALR